MEEYSKIDRQKVIDEFDRRAKQYESNDAVLDASGSEKVKRQNVYRDYLSKQILRKYLRPNLNDVVVDFGCGVGRISRFLSPGVAKVEAMDKSKEMINVAKKITSGVGNIDYRIIEGERIPLADASATKFFSWWVLQHSDNEEVLSILKDAVRVIKPAGLVFLFEQVKNASTVIGGMHHMRTTAEYISIAQNAGLTFVSHERVFRFPSYALDIWQKFDWLPKAALPALTVVEALTVNRKPDTIGYSTDAFVFKKS